jgi:RNA polymerase sigma-70 factor (ECF subfamily)
VDPRTDAGVIGESLDDPRLFADVYDRHAGVVFRFLVRRVGRDAADELLGETFRIAFERRDTYDVGRANARPWLYGIATNLVAKHRRKEARRLRATALLAADGTSEALDDRVVEHVDAGRLWPHVVHRITELPGGERDALLLYVWEELSYDEIAVALEVPVGTVRSRLNRARRRMRELMTERGEQTATTNAAGRSRIAP